MIIFLTLNKKEGDHYDLISSLYTKGIYPVVAKTGAKSIASGYNWLVKEVESKVSIDPIICFIHNDARIHFNPQEMEKYFERLPNVGIVGFVGCRTLSLDGRWWLDNDRMGSLIQGPGTDINFTLAPVEDYAEAASVDGYCFFVRMSVLKSLGGFDERYQGWHYYDADLCTKARQGGYTNYVVNLKSQHLSGGTLDEDWERSREQFMEKWKGTLE